MENEIGRASSRQTALQTLEDARQYIPDEVLSAYMAALNRTRYEFRRHEPVPPKIINGWARCGRCGQDIKTTDNYCHNCGREIKK